MDGNIIYIGENYIAGASDTFGAKLHRHPLIEIYVSCDGESRVATPQGGVHGEVIAIGPNAYHAIAGTGKPGIALFIDPLTETGYSLLRELLTVPFFRRYRSWPMKAAIMIWMDWQGRSSFPRAGWRMCSRLRRG